MKTATTATYKKSVDLTMEQCKHEIKRNHFSIICVYITNKVEIFEVFQVIFVQFKNEMKIFKYYFYEWNGITIQQRFFCPTKRSSAEVEQTSVASFLFCCSIYVMKLSEED